MLLSLICAFASAYGGGGEERAYPIEQTSDGGYIVAGYTTSWGAGGKDILVIKVDSSGNISWAKTFGDTGDEGGWLVQQASDGDYVATGYTTSWGVGGKDFFVLKLPPNGSYPGCVEDCTPNVQSFTPLVSSPTPDVTICSVSANCNPDISSPAPTQTEVCIPSGVVESGNRDRLSLAISPIPFKKRIRIQYEVPSLSYGEQRMISLKIYDIKGSVVKVLVNGHQKPGSYIMIWDAKDDRGNRVASGIYFCKLRIDDKSLSTLIPCVK